MFRAEFKCVDQRRLAGAWLARVAVLDFRDASKTGGAQAGEFRKDNHRFSGIEKSLHPIRTGAAWILDLAPATVRSIIRAMKCAWQHASSLGPSPTSPFPSTNEAGWRLALKHHPWR
jgi:hypothetical protein